jgi:hypothetical protein
MSSSAKFVSIVRLVLIPMGLAFLVAALFTYNKTNEFVSGAVGTEGTVASIQNADTSEGPVQRTTVRFDTLDGSVIRFTSDTQRGSDPPKQGDKVSVLYRPEEPGNARIEDFAALWGRAMILGVVGVGVLAMGLILRRRSARK